MQRVKYKRARSGNPGNSSGSLRCPKLCAAQTAMPPNSLCHPIHCATQITMPPKSPCHPNCRATHITAPWGQPGSVPQNLFVSQGMHMLSLPKQHTKVAAMQNPPVTPQKPAVHPTPGFHQPELGACEAAGHAGDGAGWSAGTRSLSSGPAAGTPLRSPQPRQRPWTGRLPALPLASV